MAVQCSIQWHEADQWQLVVTGTNKRALYLSSESHISFSSLRSRRHWKMNANFKEGGYPVNNPPPGSQGMLNQFCMRQAKHFPKKAA
jgi:hypothetical protein